MEKTMKYEIPAMTPSPSMGEGWVGVSGCRGTGGCRHGTTPPPTPPHQGEGSEYA
jgi:hypothetical protein